MASIVAFDFYEIGGAAVVQPVETVGFPARAFTPEGAAVLQFYVSLNILFDGGTPFESYQQHLAGSLTPLEWYAILQADRAFLEEILINLIRDSGVPEEWTSPARTIDAGIPFESLQIERAISGGTPIEWLFNLVRNETPPEEVLAQIRDDASIPIEWTSPIRLIDGTEPIEILQALIADRVFLFESKQSQALRDFDLLYEAAGLPLAGLLHQWTGLRLLIEPFPHDWKVMGTRLSASLTHTWTVKGKLISVGHTWRVLKQSLITAFNQDVHKPTSMATLSP